MADWTPIYNKGTASVGAGSTNVTGQATTWNVAGLRPGDQFKAAGLSVTITAINANGTQLTIAPGWPGAARTTDSYEILRVSDADRLIAAHADLMAALVPNLTAVGGLQGAANKLSFFTGPSAIGLTDLTAFARSLLDDANAAAARTTLGANDAANLTAGEVANARLPARLRELMPTSSPSLNNEPSGWSYATGATDAASIPPGINAGVTSGAAMTARISGDSAAQMYIHRSAAPQAFLRRQLGGSWADYLEMVTFNHFATITNANGIAMRCNPLRLQICVHTIDLGSVINAGDGSFSNPYRTGLSNWSFPASFASSPAIGGMPLVNSGVGTLKANYITARTVSTSQASGLQVYRASGAATDISATATLIAVGAY